MSFVLIIIIKHIKLLLFGVSFYSHDKDADFINFIVRGILDVYIRIAKH